MESESRKITFAQFQRMINSALTAVKKDIEEGKLRNIEFISLNPQEHDMEKKQFLEDMFLKILERED